MQSAFYESFAEGLKPIQEMKSKMLEFFYNDDEFLQLIKWSREQPVLQSVEKQVASSMGISGLPLKLIEDNCTKTAEDLAQSSVILCVYGSVNVGKSTFCNLLMNGNVLHVTNVQCTAVNTVVSSAPTLSNAKVVFDARTDVRYVDLELYLWDNSYG